MDSSETELPPIEKQRAVFERALAIHEAHLGERDIWAESGWRGSLIDIRKKLDRIWTYWDGTPRGLEREQQILDDALDILNYTAFFIRNVEMGNRDGKWPWHNE